MYIKKVVEKSFEHIKLEKLRCETPVLHEVINILNRVLNSFEYFVCYTKSIIYLLVFCQKSPYIKFVTIHN